MIEQGDGGRIVLIGSINSQMACRVLPPTARRRVEF